uniref:Uncharacterized protein n=1 Tax=Macrostomum lignano TaxID=282301 RepID=A0A1I8GZ80_9PLAT
MIRTTAGSNLGGKGAGFDAAPLALWTTRQPGGTGQQPALNSNFISSRSGPAAASGQFHLPFPMAVADQVPQEQRSVESQKQQKQKQKQQQQQPR